MRKPACRMDLVSIHAKGSEDHRRRSRASRTILGSTEPLTRKHSLKRAARQFDLEE
jgi:hypothetical protein